MILPDQIAFGLLELFGEILFGGMNKSRFFVCAKRLFSTRVLAFTTPFVERLNSSSLTWSGVQFGCSSRINAAAPATCGAILSNREQVVESFCVS